MQYDIEIIGKDTGYELLDSGDGEKLERFGDFVLARPDPQALWRKGNPAMWKDAHASFSRDADKGDWDKKAGTPSKWTVDFAGLKLIVKPTAFKHTGVFPEQKANWEWMSKLIQTRAQAVPDKEIQILNLFAYTGGATLAAAKAGAHVVHADSSKSAVTWAKENAEASGLQDKPIRFILDDARDFVAKELRRGNKYDGIILDPPAFGHGPNRELWKIEEHFIPLIKDAKALLSDNPLFFLMSGYAAGYSALAYQNNILDLPEKFGGKIQIGELALEESGEKKRLLPAGIFTRWSN